MWDGLVAKNELWEKKKTKKKNKEEKKKKKKTPRFHELSRPQNCTC